MKIDRVTILSTIVLISAGCTPSASYGQVDPDWLRSWKEAVQDRPATLASTARIADSSEAGPPLIILGEVVDPDGLPASDVVVHSYHRDQEGFDFGPNDTSATTWRLQGWAVTDSRGRFEFRTVRPAADHLGREAAHIHFTLESERYGRQWAPKVFFADDPLVTAVQRQRSENAGEFGFVREVEVANGTQRISVMIRLKRSADF